MLLVLTKDAVKHLAQRCTGVRLVRTLRYRVLLV
jgi:hypothetical protein